MCHDPGGDCPTCGAVRPTSRHQNLVNNVHVWSWEVWRETERKGRGGGGKQRGRRTEREKEEGKGFREVRKVEGMKKKERGVCVYRRGPRGTTIGRDHCGCDPSCH